jgi:feruloyl esterase
VRAGLLIAAFSLSAAAHAGGTACEKLVSLTLTNVEIRSTTLVPAGEFKPTDSSSTLTLPAFCRIEAVARPSADSEIHFEVWIPPAGAWNGKFQGVGNGNYAGSISYRCRREFRLHRSALKR